MKNTVDFIISELQNDEYSTDDDLAEWIIGQTNLESRFVNELIEKERDGFLKNPLMEMDTATEIIKKYIKRDDIDIDALDSDIIDDLMAGDGNHGE